MNKDKDSEVFSDPVDDNSAGNVSEPGGSIPLMHHSVSKVSVKVPPFYAEKPALWFAQVEAQFSVSGISADATKYNLVISQLDPRYAEEIEDILTSPPSTGKYDKLKTELIKRLSASKERKVKQLLNEEELGDRKPSQFLRRLKDLAGPGVPDDFVRTIWTSRLPGSTQTIIASQSDMDLTKLAELADRIHDIVPCSPQVAATSVQSSSAYDNMARTIAQLTKQVSELSAEVRRGRHEGRGRSRSGSRRNRSSSTKRSSSSYQRFPICWYHRKYGDKCHPEKCVLPCDYKPVNSQGSQ